MASGAPDLLGHIDFESEPVDHSASSAGSSDRGDGYTPEGPAATLFFEQPKPAAAAAPDALAPVKEKAAEELFGRMVADSVMRISRSSSFTTSHERSSQTFRGGTACALHLRAQPADRRDRCRRARLGPLENLLADPPYRDHGQPHDQIYVERNGRLYESSSLTGERSSVASSSESSRRSAAASTSRRPSSMRGSRWLPRERDHPSPRRQRAVAHHPKVRREPRSRPTI